MRRVHSRTGPVQTAAIAARGDAFGNKPLPWDVHNAPGLIVGAAAGALVGRAVDTHGERATGTILGAAAGAIIGRNVNRGRYRCR